MYVSLIYGLTMDRKLAGVSIETYISDSWCYEYSEYTNGFRHFCLFAIFFAFKQD